MRKSVTALPAKQAILGQTEWENAITNWLDATRQHTDWNVCAHCGGLEAPNRPLAPFGVEEHSVGGTWVHLDCWREWFRCRRADAWNALEELGQFPPPGWTP